MSQLSNNDKVVNESASEVPELCNSCFEFFGSKHNNGLCSKCFKEKSKVQEKTVNIITNTLPEVTNHRKDTAATSQESSRKPSAEEEKPLEEVKQAEPEKPKEVNKCGKCSKKVSVLGFQCKCGPTFCKAHRLPEDHDCEYDFKADAKAKLNKDNPVVMASKINKI